MDQDDIKYDDEAEKRLGPQPQSLIDTTPEVTLSEKSVMMCVNIGLDLLYEWSGYRKMKLELIYRGSRDGTSLLQMHGKVNGNSPTFTFI